jgi:hypothetical protein
VVNWTIHDELMSALEIGNFRAENFSICTHINYLQFMLLDVQDIELS